MFGFGTLKRERQLVKALRRRPPEPALLEELEAILRIQRSRAALPWRLLWNAQAWAEQARQQLPEHDAMHQRLSEIRRSALWEIQYREMRGV